MLICFDGYCEFTRFAKKVNILANFRKATKKTGWLLSIFESYLFLGILAKKTIHRRE